LLKRTLPFVFVAVLMLLVSVFIDHSQAADVEINVTETVTVIDTISTLPSVMISVSEAVGISDSIGTQPSAWIEISEPVTVSDAVSVDMLPVVQINISETVTVTDTVTPLPSLMINVSEPVGVSDSIDTQPSAWIEISEPVTVSDAVSVDIYPVVDIIISETVSVIDALTIRPSVMISVSELVNVSDSIDAQSLFGPLADAGGIYIGVEGLSLTLDGSGSFDPDGSIVLYEWDIDDDGIYEYSSSSPTQSQTYLYESIFTIRLRVTDNQGLTGEAITYASIVDSSPTVDFASFPTNGTPPLTVYFMNYSDGYDLPLSYEWDFENDGITDSTLPDPSHEYPLGIYSVKLKVTDSDGSISTLVRTNYISSCLSPVRITEIPPLYYSTIQSAYSPAFDGDTIQSRDLFFTENLTLNRGILIYFEGGFNCGYTVNEGITVIYGDITISDGTLIINSGTLEVQ
jgi:PKD repeat protein